MDLTKERNERMSDGECPDCGTSIFLHGPCGGMAENIRCFECGAEFNWCPPLSTERLDRNEPAFYHGAFNLRDEVRQYHRQFDEPEKPWWKRFLGL